MWVEKITAQYSLVAGEDKITSNTFLFDIIHFIKVHIILYMWFEYSACPHPNQLDCVFFFSLYNDIKAVGRSVKRFVLGFLQHFLYHF